MQGQIEVADVNGKAVGVSGSVVDRPVYNLKLDTVLLEFSRTTVSEVRAVIRWERESHAVSF